MVTTLSVDKKSAERMHRSLPKRIKISARSIKPNKTKMPRLPGKTRKFERKQGK